MSIPYRSFTLRAGVVLLALAACSNSDANEPGATANFQALHATPSLGAVTVLVDGVPVVSGLTFGATSPVVSIGAGQRHFVVQAGSTILGDLQYTPDETHINSLVISDSAPQFSAFVEPDTGQPVATKANIRLVNVVGSNLTAPTQLNVRIKAPNANPDSVVTSNLDATIASYWSLMYFDPGAFNITFVPAGDDSVLAETSFDVAAGVKKAVVLGRSADGTYHVEVVTEP